MQDVFDMGFILRKVLSRGLPMIWTICIFGNGLSSPPNDRIYSIYIAIEFV